MPSFALKKEVMGWMGVARDRGQWHRGRAVTYLSSTQTRSVCEGCAVGNGVLMLRYAGQDAFCCRKQKMAARNRQGAPCSFRDGLRLCQEAADWVLVLTPYREAPSVRELGRNGGSVQSVFRPCYLGSETLLEKIVRRGLLRLPTLHRRFAVRDR